MMQRRHIMGVAALCAAVATVVAWVIMPGEYKGDVYLQASALLISANIAASVTLTILYAYIYTQVRTKFSLALLLVMFTLMLYSVTANPILHAACGFCPTSIGFLTILPDVFAAIAVWTLAYISLE